ncbi:MAG TPA: DMT family transporter [Firmicutes bacterium]|nr:DMT family transporter [Bacillota bacterium]
MEDKTKLAYLAAITYAVIIGLSFLFSKVALQYAAPIDLLAYRFSASCLALSVPILYKRKVMRLTFRRFVSLAPLAIFYPLLFFSFQTFGLRLATSSEAGIMQASAPVFIMLLARHFLGERLNAKQKASVLVSVLGVVFILVMKGSAIGAANFKGLVLLLCSVLSFSAYNILARKLVRNYTNWELSFAMMFLSFLVFVPLSIIGHLRRGSLAALLVPLQSRGFVLSVLYLGVLSTLGTSMLNNYALSQLEASRVSVFGNLGTVISMLAGVLFLQEKLFYYHLLGTFLIIIGVVGTNYFALAKGGAKCKF